MNRTWIIFEESVGSVAHRDSARAAMEEAQHRSRNEPHREFHVFEKVETFKGGISRTAASVGVADE